METNRFREALEKREFVYTLELVPGRGARGKVFEDTTRMAEKAIRVGKVHALSITDNAGGHPALFPNVLGREICGMGMNPIIHFTCKDKNRNQIESILYALDRIGIENLLVMTGDYPLYGFEGKAKPVYDLDSIQLLHLIKTMNEGKCIDGKAPGGGTECLPTHFLKGCAVSPFKMRKRRSWPSISNFIRRQKRGRISSSPRWDTMPASSTKCSVLCGSRGSRFPSLEMFIS
jgi:methylenetetrahydrofolate reductase (NADPH)